MARTFMVPAAAALGLALASLGCGGAAPTPPEIPAGAWAGDGVRATVGADGASLALDCAAAAMAPPLTLDAEGHFELAGWWERQAGPEPYERRAARFGGRLHRGRLTLTVRVPDTGETLGPYELQQGEQGRPPRLCR